MKIRKIRNGLLGLIMMAMFFFNPTAFAGDGSNIYWVSATGTATWSDCESATPLNGTSCCTLSTANSNASAGDTVNLRGGTYTGVGIYPSNSGTAWDNQIIFQAYTGETPTVTGSVVAIRIFDKDYIKVDGITGSNVSRFYLIGNGADNNEIANCTFDTCSTYSAGLISFYDAAWAEGTISTYNWIHDNTFARFGRIVSCQDHGTIRIGDSGDDSKYNLIEDNVFYYGGHDCLDIGGRYNTIRNNIMHNEEAYYEDPGGCVNSPDSGYFGDRCLLIQDYTSGTQGRHLIEGNRAGHAGSPPDDDGAFGIAVTSPNNIVRYNFIFGSGAAGINMKQATCDDNRIYNNTIYYNGYGDPDIGNIYRGGMDWSSCRNQTGNTWVNNIFYDNNVLDYQTCSGNTNTNAWLTTNGDPSFANPDMSDKTSLTLPDLSLRSGSGAIDAGVALTTVDNSDTGSGTSLIVEDASYFQDGSWGPNNQVQADWIAVGTVGNVVQISSISYSTNTITLTNSISRYDGNSVWLYKDSSGKRVLNGNAADIGAYEYVGTRNGFYSLSGSVKTITDEGIEGVNIEISGQEPVTTDSSGNYIKSDLPNGTYTVVPSKSGYTFDPTSQKVTISGSDVTAIDFIGTKTPITVTITDPTSSSTFANESDYISLAGTVSGNIGDTTVTWTNSRGGSGTASGTYNWTISDVALYCGEDNIITVTAEDATKNSGTDTLVVDVKPCYPRGIKIK